MGRATRCMVLYIGLHMSSHNWTAVVRSGLQLTPSNQFCSCDRERAFCSWRQHHERKEDGNMFWPVWTMTKTLITRSVNCLYTKALTCPEDQCAWALAPSLFGEKKTRLVQKQSFCAILLRPRANWNEVGLYLCWGREMWFTQNEFVVKRWLPFFCWLVVSSSGSLSGSCGSPSAISFTLAACAAAAHSPSV